MEKKALLFLIPLTLCASVVFGQTSTFMDQLMASGKMNWGQAAYLVLVSSDNLAEDASEQRSLDLLKEMHWAESSIAASAPISLSQYTFLLMKAFGVKGGLFYTFFPGPRYAFREMSFRFIVTPSDDPDQTLDGPSGIRILGKVMDVYATKKGDS